MEKQRVHKWARSTWATWLMSKVKPSMYAIILFKFVSCCADAPIFSAGHRRSKKKNPPYPPAVRKGFESCGDGCGSRMGEVEGKSVIGRFCFPGFLSSKLFGFCRGIELNGGKDTPINCSFF